MVSHKAMPIKELRSTDDIEEAGRDLARRWRQGDGVEPFLRKVEPELSQRVRDNNWSWESVARSLNHAGIIYQTGREWTGELLSQKIRAIRYKRRARTRSAVPDDSAASVSAPPASANGAPVTAMPTVRAVHQAELDKPCEEPEFRPATLLGWKRPAVPDVALASVSKPAARPVEAVDVDAVIARLIGKK